MFRQLACGNGNIIRIERGIKMEKLILSNGLELAYEEDGEGKTVILLHGFCGSHSYWDYVFPTLTQNSHVIRMDLRGHGQSGEANGEFSIDDMADDVAGFLEKKKLKNVCLLGHSLGGYITLAFADKYPKMLSAIGLIHSTAFPDSEEAKAGRDASVQKIKNEGINEFVNQLVPKLFSNNQVEDAQNTVKEIGYRTNQEGAIHSLMAMKLREDKRQVLENSDIPILLVAGKEDKVIPPEKVFSTEGTHITKVNLEKSGHMSMYEQPNELVLILRNFIKQI